MQTLTARRQAYESIYFVGWGEGSADLGQVTGKLGLGFGMEVRSQDLRLEHGAETLGLKPGLESGDL